MWVVREANVYEWTVAFGFIPSQIKIAIQKSTDLEHDLGTNCH